MLLNLVNEVLNKKWPKNENETELFKFIFECNHFLKAFFFIGELIKLFKFNCQKFNNFFL